MVDESSADESMEMTRLRNRRLYAERYTRALGKEREYLIMVLKNVVTEGPDEEEQRMLQSLIDKLGQIEVDMAIFAADAVRRYVERKRVCV